MKLLHLYFLAGEIRVLYIQSDADMVTKQGKVGPITVQNLTQILSEHVTVQECGLFAYLSVEREVVILITPTVKKPSNLQVSNFTSTLLCLVLCILCNMSLICFWTSPM